VSPARQSLTLARCPKATHHVGVIQRLQLYGFKAFHRFRLDVGHDAYLAGPNNAGKTTLIAALRVAANMVRIAMRLNPTETFADGNQQVLGYSFASRQVGLVDENLRHEFREVETRLSLRFKTGATLTAVWPTDTQNDPFFYLQEGRASINSVRDARDVVHDIGVIPILSPIDGDEEVLTDKYVRENLDGRLASRHFRNQLWLLMREPRGADFQAFLDFAAPWVPEIELQGLDRHMGDKNFILDLYYKEAGRRTEKELFWIGDGMQIWLQLLLHVFRLRDRETLVIDEPDVFLHPDLQRRLVRLLDSLDGQTITATHSSEVLSEAAPESVVWVDKDRTRSVVAPDPAALSGLAASLGSQFNLPLARALRAKCVLFVEGNDLKILRQVAATVGAGRIATETGVAVISLRGFDNWEHVEPFSWMIADLLESSVSVFVLVDRDFRSEPQCRAVQTRLKSVGVKCHIWKRKELESYLLEPSLIARISGAEIDWAEQALLEAANECEEDVFAQVMTWTLREFQRDHQNQAAKEARRRFNALWDDPAHRKWVAPPEKVLHGLNRRLDDAQLKPVSFRLLARRITASEVASEMSGFLERVEDVLIQAGVPDAAH